MPMSLSALLQHPSLIESDPVVRAGAANLHRPVRWIHSSEVLEIASLLHGGELLLTGGVLLAASQPAERRRYIRQLAARQVSGVAIETGTSLSSIPADMLEEADAHGFPVIELRAVVRFVDVAEAVNGAILDSSVTLLKYAAELAHILSGIVADGGGTQEVLDEVAHRAGTRVALFDGAGALIASVSGAHDGDSGYRTEADATITSPIFVRGMHAATLALYPTDESDLELLHLAADRACESLGFTLLRSRPPSIQDLAVSELVRLAGSKTPNPERLAYLAQLIGLQPSAPVLGIVGATSESPAALSRLDRVVRRYGRTLMDRPAESELHAIVSFNARRGVGEARASLLDDLRDWATAHRKTTIVVGPAFPDLFGAPTSLTAALETMRLPQVGDSVVVDARQHSVDRLFLGDGRPRAERIVSEQLAVFDRARPRDRELLLESLETYFATGCNKSAAAGRLHVERQTLHARLRRAFNFLGGDPTGTPSALPLQLALHLRASPNRDNPGPGIAYVAGDSDELAPKGSIYAAPRTPRGARPTGSP